MLLPQTEHLSPRPQIHVLESNSQGDAVMRWSPHDGVSALIRDPRELPAPSPCVDTGRNCRLQARKRVPTRPQICWPLDLRIPASTSK